MSRLFGVLAMLMFFLGIGLWLSDREATKRKDCADQGGVWLNKFDACVAAPTKKGQ